MSHKTSLGKKKSSNHSRTMILKIQHIESKSAQPLSTNLNVDLPLGAAYQPD